MKSAKWAEFREKSAVENLNNFYRYPNVYQKKAKELFYKASKIYTNFYDEQPKTVQNEHKIFGHKDQGKRYHVDAELSNLTYEMIEGVPIYYIILRDLYLYFGITYEELIQDIKNKLL